MVAARERSSFVETNRESGRPRPGRHAQDVVLDRPDRAQTLWALQKQLSATDLRSGEAGRMSADLPLKYGR